MASSRTFLKDATTRHSIFVNRLAGGELKKLLPFLESVQRETIGKLSGGELTTFKRDRLRRLYAGLDGLLVKIYDKVGDTITEGAKEFGEYEAGFSARMYSKGTDIEFDVPTPELIHAAVFSKPLSLGEKGINVAAAIKEFGKQKRKQILATINRGVIAGKTNSEIVKNIRVLGSIQRNHAHALVRTIANHTSTVARTAVLAGNKDIGTKYQWVSTLDGRTSPQCRALDGKIFEEGKGPKPPIHWNCRSDIVPIVEEEFNLQLEDKLRRAARGQDGTSGTVPYTSTYNSWLQDQPKKFQIEVLGEKRAKLFRDGGLSMSQFVDENYKPLTLDGLRKKEPLAFERAGLTIGDES